eukprot:scaffold274912_cov19-Tisochrysis_lutea.AAC.2
MCAQLNSDLGCKVPSHGDLTKWSHQGEGCASQVCTRSSVAMLEGNIYMNMITAALKVDESDCPDKIIIRACVKTSLPCMCMKVVNATKSCDEVPFYACRLNTVLTVRQGQANSHKSKGWEKFTDACISQLSQKRRGDLLGCGGKGAPQMELLVSK